jgi:hypothetical protein
MGKYLVTIPSKNRSPHARKPIASVAKKQQLPEINRNRFISINTPIYLARLQPPNSRAYSSLVELGVSTSLFARTPLTIDVGVQGYFGQREGVTGGLKVNY